MVARDDGGRRRVGGRLTSTLGFGVEGLVPTEHRGGREEGEAGWMGRQGGGGGRLDRGSWPVAGRAGGGR
jgi:hypothetical protein